MSRREKIAPQPSGINAAEFKRKWARYQGKETSAYQEHFNDLCRLLGQPTPAEADPSGADFFCFQKRVVKDAELFELHDSGEPMEPNERGLARTIPAKPTSARWLNPS